MSKRPPPNSFPAIALFAALLAGCGGGGDETLAPYWVENGIAVADLDGDGRNDVVVARTYIADAPPHPGSVDVYLRTDGGSFAPPVSYPVGTDPWNLAVGDVDGDDLPDIAVANTSSLDVAVLRQDKERPGNFLPAQFVTVPGVPYAVAIADFDRDDRADLAVALQNAGGGAAVLLRQATEAGDPLEFRLPIALPNGSGASAIAAGDLDADGWPDVLINGDAALTLFRNARNGSFGAGLPLAAGVRPSAVAIAPVDADGLNDVVASNAGSAADGSGASVSVLRQIAGFPGTFQAALNYPVANGARHLAVGQLVGDAAPDVAVVSLVYAAQQGSTLSVMENRLSGGLVLFDRTLVGPFSGDFVAVGRINDDPLPDVVVNDGPVVYLRDPLSGNFAPPTPLR